MAFFQRPTDYPCQLILDPQNDYETLRQRVEQTTLKAQTVNRNRSGVTNVRARGRDGGTAQTGSGIGVLPEPGLSSPGQLSWEGPEPVPL